MEIHIQWVIILSWVITMFFYGSRLYNIARSKGISVLQLLRIPTQESYSAIKAKKFVLSMMIATLLCIMGLLVAYFVQSSS